MKPKTYTYETLERYTEESMDIKRFMNRLRLTPREFCKLFQFNYDSFVAEMHLTNFMAPEKWKPQIRGMIKKMFKERGYKLIKSRKPKK